MLCYVYEIVLESMVLVPYATKFFLSFLISFIETSNLFSGFYAFSLAFCCFCCLFGVRCAVLYGIVYSLPTNKVGDSSLECPVVNKQVFLVWHTQPVNACTDMHS